MGTPDVEFLLIMKAGYALCGGIGAILAVAMTPVKATTAVGRSLAGIGVCFLFAEPIRTYCGMSNDPHTAIGLNGVFGFASWYFIGGLDRAAKALFAGDTFADLLGLMVRKKLGLPAKDPSTPPTESEGKVKL